MAWLQSGSLVSSLRRAIGVAAACACCSAALVTGAFVLAPAPAMAACAAAVPADGATVTCSGATVDQNPPDGYTIKTTNNVTVNVETGASITATDTGIWAGNNTVVNNAGTITANNGAGVFTNAGPLTVVNTFVINGSNQGVNGRAAVNVTNSGGITGSGSEGISAGGLLTVINNSAISSNLDNGIGADAGGSITNNSGATITGKVGIQANVGAGGLAVINGGTIWGKSGTAIGFEGTGNSLTLTPGYFVNGNAVNAVLNATNLLQLGGNGAGSFDISEIGSHYQNFGAFNKVGNSTFSATGTSTFTGPAAVNGGTLSANGNAASFSLITVNAGGTLGGTGTLGATVVAAGGTLAPGNSIGTINSGPITFNAGSVYAVEVNSAGASDKTLVTGTATLNGGTVQVLAAAGAYNDSTIYTILTSTGTTTGTFSGVTSNLAFLAPALSYDPSNVYLTLTRTATTAAALGQTPNQIATGTGLDGASINAPYLGTLLGLSAAEVPGALDQLSGEGHASLKGALLEDSDAIRRAVNERIALAFAALEAAAPQGYATAPADPAENPGYVLWGHAYGRTGVLASDGNAAQAAASAGGFLIGADTAMAGDWRLGLLAGAGVNAFSARNTAASSVDLSIAAYGGADLGVVQVSFGAGLTHHQISTSRTITLPGVADTVTAAYGANTAQVFGEIAHKFDLGALSLTPFAALAAVVETTDGFTETGAPGALSSAASSSSAVFTTLGFRAEHAFVLGDGMLVRAEGSLGWRHAFADLPTATNSFAAGTPFTVAAAPIARDTLALSAGLTLDASASLKLKLRYDGEIGSGLVAHALTLTVAGSF